MNTKEPAYVVVDGNVSQSQNLRKHGKILGSRQAQQPTQQQQQHRRQVRRRLHGGRPYQERLLNMAEARREIVTALRYHRASKKQASEEQKKQQHHLQQLQLQQQQQSLPSHISSFERDGRFKSRIYTSCTKFSNYMDDFSYSPFSHPPPSVSNSSTNTVTSPFTYNPPPMAENHNFTLPNQTLGLNLNLHHFNDLEATLFLNNNNNSSSLCPYSSPTSSSPTLSVVTDQEVPSTGISQGERVSSMVETIESSTTTQVTGGLHTAMDDEGMAEIRSIGEQYQMEWNDTMCLVTSAWWFNFLKNMEHDAKDGAYHNVYDELIEFSAWLNNANENWLEQCSEDYFHDLTLPW